MVRLPNVASMYASARIPSLFFNSFTNNNVWSSALLWIVFLSTISLLLRSYFVPWLFSTLSNHVRIRSASLRSIRGLYIRAGTRVISVDRVRYTFSWSTGLNVKLDALNIDMGRRIKSSPTRSTFPRHHRRLTLADFAPSPIARRLWNLISTAYLLFEPHFRPFIRTSVVAALRLLIRWLPHIVSGLTFEAYSTTISFPAHPRISLSAQKLSLHVGLRFSDLENVMGSSDHVNTLPRSTKPTRSYGMAAWRKRLTASFHRTLDRAWGNTQGNASILLRFHHLSGMTQTTPSTELSAFFGLPGTIDFDASVGFNPRMGTADPHSLEISLIVGDCTVGLDTLMLLMKSFGQQEPEDQVQPDSSAASSSPASSPSSADIQGIPSPYFMPTPRMDTSFGFNMTPPMSPSSPFLDVLSSSIRSRRRPPCIRLKNLKSSSVLSVLHSATLKISTITVATQPKWGQEPYELKIKDINIGSSLRDDSSQNSFHQCWLGHATKLDHYDAEILGFSVSISQTTLIRRTSLDTMNLLSLETFNIEAFATQWPAPWLMPSRFMSGDPNAAQVCVRGKVGALNITERLERLGELVAHVEPPAKKQSKPSALPYSIEWPRVTLELECGPLHGRLICADTGTYGPFAVEARNDGFVISVHSRFREEPRARVHRQPSDSGNKHLRLDYDLFFHLNPTLVKLRSRMDMSTRTVTSLHSLEPDFLDDPSILSIESFECRGDGHATASTGHESVGVVSVVTSSPIVHLIFSCDALCFEMWNPRVTVAIHQLLSILSNREEESHPSSSSSSSSMAVVPQPLLDRMPSGISLTASLARFVVFVTSPDINPHDHLELSRGFVLRTGVSVHYSSFHARHASRFHDLSQHTQGRQKLRLAQEHIVEAVTSARGALITQRVSSHVLLRLSNLALRSAVATPYDADNPLIFERDEPVLAHQEFLHVPSVHVNVNLSGKRDMAPSKLQDNCKISVSIPNVRGTFELAYVYSLMLAIQGSKSLFTLRSPRRPAEQHPSQLAYEVRVIVKTLQVMCCLNAQKIAMRFDGISLHASSDQRPSIQMNRLLAWVLLTRSGNKWEDMHGPKWEEFICCQDLKASLPTSGAPLAIPLEGQSLRVRIPYGWILADLITDAVITAKAVKHLSHITSYGRYSPMLPPEPEGPKAVPNITVKFHSLCLEAADDSLENKLSVIWRCGLDAVKPRMERETAFQAKVAAIDQAESELISSQPTGEDLDYHFGPKHTISIDEARRRLDGVHELDWTLRLQNIRQSHSKSEEVVNQTLRGKHDTKRGGVVPNIAEVTPIEPAPPLFRLLFNEVSLSIHEPSFPAKNLPDFLYERGSGLPRDTEFSLLVPLHITFTLGSLHITLRDYPLPLFSIPPNADGSTSAWMFDTDLVVAEEMGSDLSVDWLECRIMEPDHGASGAAALYLAIPKTIMPVKTYANPVVHVTTHATTVLSWGVSYNAAIQDLTRVIETLSTAPRDASPSLGFWDKMRLIFHWTLAATFKDEVRLYIKGSRNPYQLSDEGAGFVLSWKGNTKLLVGQKNEDKELIQVISDSMFIAIPNLEHLYFASHQSTFAQRIPETTKPFRKICAKVRSGVRFGIGIALERTCGHECPNCSGSEFHRQCRYFSFRPHYEIRLEKKLKIPEIKSTEDSYNGFRSDFIHLSFSLTSSTRAAMPGLNHEPSSIHLTPKAFAHFWAWSALFDSSLSLPIRQGSYYPPRIVSPKFARHLATLKYRLHIKNLFLMHAYIDESRETWVDGVVPWIGIKGLIQELHADVHQRDEESVVPGLLPDATKILRRKPVYAAEVSLKGLDFRVLLATFQEPLRQAVEMTAPPQRSNYRAHKDLQSTPSVSVWYDLADFVEVDWTSFLQPKLHLLPVLTCPQFTYFRRNSAVPKNSKLASKFGDEDSHTCLLGKSLPVPQVQAELAEARIRELKKLVKHRHPKHSANSHPSPEKMMALLEEYVSLLRGADTPASENHEASPRNYLMPAYTVSPAEWAEFENVYHIHCPKVLMDSTTRDIVLQYYYCSLARKGLEYHMATRAVKFIRDQAEAALEGDSDSDSEIEDESRSWGATATAQFAASTLRKFLKGDASKPSVDVEINAGRDRSVQRLETFDPLQGWYDGVSLRRSHCCLLLKPQVVMRAEDTKGAIIVAAVQAKLQSFAIMDDTNADDPICGKVMSRSHTTLSGLQTFAPTSLSTKETVCVPLEVLIDLRCESPAFDRLVPQTDAIFLYDKFNRLRLRNNITSVARNSSERDASNQDSHLQDQTDLVRVHIPRFTVSAGDEHFQVISHVITRLVLFSDAAHKTRLEKLETLLFTYDFTDLPAAAKVVSDLQCQLGEAIEAQSVALYSHSRRLEEEDGQLELLRLKAHIFLLSEELNFLFDAIKLAQDRHDDRSDQKSALLLHASSSEISWRMLDDRKELLSKLVIQHIDFFWLSRQDSSISNNVSVSNLQAFDGSRHATWTEIVSKHDEPLNHPLLKRGLFLLASWTILAPVGGITIYESFELSLHPIRLQIDARVGQRIMEYLWPARKHRHEIEEATSQVASKPAAGQRTSLDSPRALQVSKRLPEPAKEELMPPLRGLSTSRSFTDLRGSTKDNLSAPTIQRVYSSETLRQMSNAADNTTGYNRNNKDKMKKKDDAAEMKTRTSRRSFVLVKISSMNLVLSIIKEGSFECHDVRIKTRDLEYRNQTWSFEELVNQFIPSNMGWKGWVKMAFHQPLLPVLPVARELISKTKWNPSSKGAVGIDIKGPPPRLPRVKALSADDDTKLNTIHRTSSTKSTSSKLGGRWRKASHRNIERIIPALPLTDEPEDAL